MQNKRKLKTFLTGCSSLYFGLEGRPTVTMTWATDNPKNKQYNTSTPTVLAVQTPTPPFKEPIDRDQSVYHNLIPAP